MLKTDSASAQDGNSTLGYVAASWARDDPQQAVAWSRQLGDEKVRGMVLGRVISAIADRAPEQAAALLAELPAASQPTVISELAVTWAQNDPDSAAAWVVQLPEGEAKSRAIGGIVVKKSQQDLVRTASWLEQLPVGASRDAAVREFTSRAVGTDPEGAATWAATISDPKMRATEIERTTGQWLRKDKAAAAQWITRSPALDDAMKQRLLRGN